MSCYRHEGAWYLRDRHRDECPGECSGCTPCTEHCTCRTGCKEHLDESHPLTAPACIGKVRENLRAIVELAALMLPEAVVKGVDSDAANLAGPATDPETWSNRKMSADYGRKWHVSLIEEDDPAHPLMVTWTWSRMLREDYDQPTKLKATVARCADYLDRTLGRMAQDDGQDFTLFASEIRACKARLEAVLHDGEQGERAAVGCFDCGEHLTRRLGKAGLEDWWTCDGCKRRYTYADYAFALKANLQDAADRVSIDAPLTAADVAVLKGVKPDTVRQWAKRGQVTQVGLNAAGKMTYRLSATGA